MNAHISGGFRNYDEYDEDFDDEFDEEFDDTFEEDFEEDFDKADFNRDDDEDEDLDEAAQMERFGQFMMDDEEASEPEEFPVEGEESAEDGAIKKTEKRVPVKSDPVEELPEDDDLIEDPVVFDEELLEDDDFDEEEEEY